MTRRFTAGVTTGLLIASLAGVLVATTRTSGTAAASPPQAPRTAHSSAASGTRPGANRTQRTGAAALQSAGYFGLSGDPGTQVMMAAKVGGLTVTAINGQTITARFNPVAMPGPFVTSRIDITGKGGFGLRSDAPVTRTIGPPGVLGPSPFGAKPGFGLESVGPVTVTINVDATTVYTRAGQAASLSDIQVGSVLNVQGTPSGNNTITASAIEIVLPQRLGVVTAISGNTITMTGFDARTYTVTVGDHTTYRRAEQAAALSDVKVGSLISAEGTLGSDGATLNALAVTIQLPHIAGRVSAVSGNTVTVQTLDGTTATVQLTDATTYSAGKQGAANKSSITAGRFIMAEGSIAGDGTLTALHVDVADDGGPGVGKGLGFGFAPPPDGGPLPGPSGDATTSGGPVF